MALPPIRPTASAVALRPDAHAGSSAGMPEPPSHRAPAASADRARQDVGLPGGLRRTPQVLSTGLADACTLRSLLLPQQQAAARHALQQAVVTTPDVPELWLQLLALDPPVAEELPLLQGFLRHHPRHPLVRPCRQRLQALERAWLAEPVAASPSSSIAPPVPQLCFGAFVVLQGWATPTQVEQALQAQGRLRAAGLPERLGTVLVLLRHLTADQLASAFATLPPRGATFGAYLVQQGVVTSSQVATALAQQASLVVERDRAVLAALAAYRQRPQLQRLRQECSARLQQPVPKLGELLAAAGLLRPDQVGALLDAYTATLVEQGPGRFPGLPYGHQLRHDVAPPQVVGDTCLG